MFVQLWHWRICCLPGSTKTMAPRRRLPLILGCCCTSIMRFFVFSSPHRFPFHVVCMDIWHGMGAPVWSVAGPRDADSLWSVSLIRYLTLMAFVRSCSDPKVLLLRFLGHFNVRLCHQWSEKVFFLSEINYYNTTLHLSKSYVCF